ncbi:hypothetical protein EVAR_13391_1 [Eumeta japonica]|uniref:Uncharacterized protein n=1 Tax=Eumeta variegata TaxID=151549 RepID=A0A4C1TS05_EUMVA|nr:hypothetical protein EVAR_13391_1 [Eumeta japonica]
MTTLFKLASVIRRRPYPVLTLLKPQQIVELCQYNGKITNSREIAQIEAWLAEDDSENEVFGDQPSSNEEEDHLEESDHQSESEQDGELPGETSADNSEPEEPPQRVRHTEFYAGVDSQKLLL